MPFVLEFDINLPSDQNETQIFVEEEVVEEGRPIRNRRAPDCGTSGRRGHLH